MGLISLGNLHLSLWKEKKKKIISHPLKKKSVPQPTGHLSFFLPLSSHPFMPALTFHFSPASNPPPFFCSFLLVIHLWQPTPPSHTSSLSVCYSLPLPRHTPPPPLAHFVRLPVSVCSAYTRSHSLCPLAWHPSTGALLRRTYFVFPRCGWYRMFVFQLWLHHFLIFPLVAETSLNPPPTPPSICTRCTPLWMKEDLFLICLLSVISPTIALPISGR